MGRVNSEAAALLVAGICRGKFWASPEETERWLKTETGQRIAALIEKERRKLKNDRPRSERGIAASPNAV